MNFLFNHNTEHNAIVVDNYPYGRHKTEKRYWIESTPKRGDRLCGQTKNPKNGFWNKPKKSTYTSIGILTKNDENGHINWEGVNIYSGAEAVKKFVDRIGGTDKLNEVQRKMYNQLLGINEVERDELTGKIKKDFSIKWEKNNAKELRRLTITFDRPDGVQIKEMYAAMKSVNQDRLKQVFSEVETMLGKSKGTVHICTRGGNFLGNVGEDEYKEWLASDHNEENK